MNLFDKIRHTLSLIRTPVVTAKSHRRLLREFVVREVKGRFAGSMAGTVWTLINPLSLIIVYFFVFSMVLRIQVTAEETGTNSFAIFFLAGLFPWLQFTDGLTRSVGCLVDNANLISKVVFPVELLPTGAIVSAFIINGIGLLGLVGYLIILGYLHLTMLLVLIILPLQLLFTWGMAFFVATACVFIRDVRELLGILLMVWFFATPIIYPYSMIPDSFRMFMDLNPMSLFVSIYRQALLSHDMDWTLIFCGGMLSVISYAVGAWFFMRAKPAFGDVL